MTRIPRLDAVALSAVAAVLLALGLVSFQRRIWTSMPVVGVEWVQAKVGPVALAVEPGSPAWVAGLRPGDFLLKANGKEVAIALEAAELPWNAAGNELRLVVRRGGRELDLEVRPGARRNPAEAYVYLSVVALAFLASSLFITIRWPTVRGGRIYSLLGISLFVLLLYSHTGRGDGVDWAIYWGDVFAGAAAPALLLHLTFALARRTSVAHRASLGLAYLGSTTVLLLSVWLVGLGGAYRFPDPVLVAETTDRLQLLSLSLAVLLGAVTLANSYQRSASGLHRSQMRWMLWGLGVGLAPVVTICGIPWAVGATVPAWVEFLAVVPMLAVPAAFSAALVRYRLHDLDLLLRRGLAEVTAVFCIMAVYAAGKVVLRHGLTGLIPLSSSGERYLAILLAAVAYPTVRDAVKRGVDRAFYRKRYSYRATLLDFGRELNAETDLPSMADRLAQRVRETLDVSEARVVVRTGEDCFETVGATGRRVAVRLDTPILERLDRDRHVPLDEGSLVEFPWARHLFGMKVKDSLRAMLVVSERIASDEHLSSEDRALLATLSAHAAAAIEAGRLLREVRQQAEHVERLQARQAHILESSAVGLLLMDGEERRILAWNRALEGIYGMTREQALGQKIEDVLPLPLTRRIERELETHGGGEEVRLYRYTLVNHAGHRIVVNLAISPASRGQGEERARVVSFDDVTERVKMEEEMLRQERLASLGLLAAGVAHEVNTPLTGISSYAQMLLEEMAPEDPRRDILERIESQSQRASSIANSLLNLARPECPAFEEVSLNDAVAEVLGLFEPQVKTRGIRVEVVLDPALPSIRGHKARIQQVLLNLLLNARDALGEEGQITVMTRAGEDRVSLEVVDNGAGIAEEDLPRIFDPFFTTKGRGRGTGLGLSISYGIVQEHAGKLTVESSPGESTRFRVDLPAAHPAQALA